MSVYHPILTEQIDLIQKAMKSAGVWSEEIPSWVQNYTHGAIPDIWQWLQFIYLPMLLKGSLNGSRYLAPQVISYLNADPAYRPLLQLIIELDALTPLSNTT